MKRLLNVKHFSPVIKTLIASTNFLPAATATSTQLGSGHMPKPSEKLHEAGAASSNTSIIFSTNKATNSQPLVPPITGG